MLSELYAYASYTPVLNENIKYYGIFSFVVNFIYKYDISDTSCRQSDVKLLS